MPHSHILIPCKALSEGKSRLSQLLSARARYELCAFLLDQTLRLAKLLALSDHIWVVTADDAAATLARSGGVAVIRDRARDLNGALSQGRDHIFQRNPAVDNGLLILPTDLPLADETAIAKVFGETAVSLAGDIGRGGTNLLFLQGDAAFEFPFSFGPGSFARHREIAHRAGYSISIVNDPTFAFDLDEPQDYLRARRLGRLAATELAS
jgi:2-phospho-L-lactate/phosphoenolpyruvate guanylyltransferase